MQSIEDILTRLPDVRKNGKGWMARCPAHDDNNASLSIGVGEGGQILLYCHAGCSFESVCTGLALTPRDLNLPRRSTRSHREIAATYDYVDASGAFLFQIVRFKPKAFRQRRPDGKGGWIWNLGDVPRVLYRLPELIAAPKDDWIIVVEGEKDVETLYSFELVATCNPGGAGKWSKLANDSALECRRVVIIADKDAPGRAHALDVANRLHGRAAQLRILELPGPGKDVSDWMTAGGTAANLLELARDAEPYAPSTQTQSAASRPADGNRPTIIIDTNEHRAVCEAIEALACDSEIYQRGGLLVRVLRSRHLHDGVSRPKGSATIGVFPKPNLRERLSKHTRFSRVDDEGFESPAHPPGWLVSAIDARGEWPCIRHLRGVSDAPVLRSDGSIRQDAGFDSETSVLYEPATSFPAIPENASLDDARAATLELLDVVCDFQFEAEEHKSAWLAGLLTPLARFAFEGPSPLFLIDANVRGAGKGLLAQTIGMIVLGHPMPVSSYSHDTYEMRKRITAIAVAGDRMILFDNLAGLFGNDAIDRALTSTYWKDRLLGKSQEVELPLIPSWYATGNNVQVSADTTRRIIHIRLDVLDEHPERRGDFKHDKLLAWIGSHRRQLLSRALTILSAYCRTGRPIHSLHPFGSFEGWSSLVREAVVWVGLPDPCKTCDRLAESADTTKDLLQQLLSAWQAYDPAANGLVMAELLRSLYPETRDQAPTDQASQDMRAAFEQLVGCRAGKIPMPRQVGNRLRAFRRRVVAGMYLDVDQSRGEQGKVWRVLRSRCESDSCIC